MSSFPLSEFPGPLCTEWKIDPSMVENPPVAVLDVVEGPDEVGEHRRVQLDLSGRPLTTQDVMHPHDRGPGMGHLGPKSRFTRPII